jgi:hypothetical protein
MKRARFSVLVEEWVARGGAQRRCGRAGPTVETAARELRQRALDLRAARVEPVESRLLGSANLWSSSGRAVDQFLTDYIYWIF